MSYVRLQVSHILHVGHPSRYSQIDCIFYYGMHGNFYISTMKE